MTGVLKHYEKDFPEKKIYLGVRKGIGADPAIFAGLADEFVYLDDRRFKKNPWYGVRFINHLRSIGFETVINHDPSIGEILGREIAIRLGARNVIGYEGLGIQFAKPYDASMAYGIRYIERHLSPHYTKLVPSIDRSSDLDHRLVPFLQHYIAIYEAVTEKPKRDYAPVLAVPADAERSMLALLKQKGVASGSYCLLMLGTSTPHREWPAERFADALAAIRDANIPVVLAGSARESVLRDRFAARYGNDFCDLIGVTSIPEAVALVHHALFVFSNDTASTHIAVALRKPSLSILGLGHLGMLSLYGYPGINRWVYSRTAPCLCDDWRCIHTVGAPDPAPCVAAIGVDQVAVELKNMISYLAQVDGGHREKFELAL